MNATTKKLSIGLMAFALCAQQMHSMQMEAAKASKKINKKECSCADMCCGMTKALCVLGAAYYVMTSGQPVNEERTHVVTLGQPTAIVIDVTPCPPPSYTLEAGYVATSWNDLIKVRNRKQDKQIGCQHSMDEDEQRTVGVDKSLEQYKDYYL